MKTKNKVNNLVPGELYVFKNENQRLKASPFLCCCSDGSTFAGQSINGFFDFYERKIEMSTPMMFLEMNHHKCQVLPDSLIWPPNRPPVAKFLCNNYFLFFLESSKTLQPLTYNKKYGLSYKHKFVHLTQLLKRVLP